MCDGWKDQIDISIGSRSLFVGQIFSENFRDSLTAQRIYPSPLRRHTFPLLSIWNLVFDLGFGTLSRITLACNKKHHEPRFAAHDHLPTVHSHGVYAQWGTNEDHYPPCREAVTGETHETICFEDHGARYIRLGYPKHEAKAKAIREITYGLWLTVHALRLAAPKQMCTHFKNVYAFQNPFRVHTITNDFNHLAHCVQSTTRMFPHFYSFKVRTQCVHKGV